LPGSYDLAFIHIDMKVFKILCDVDNYQSLFPVSDQEWATLAEEFEGDPIKQLWKPFRFFCLKPRLKAGDFYYFQPNAFIVSGTARIKAATPLEMSGQLLPITVEGREGEEFFVYNVTNCINVLDSAACTWENSLPTGEKWGIAEYAFFPDRFSENSIFKIPQDVEIFVVERNRDPEHEEFKAIVESMELKGLVFEEVWSYDSDVLRKARPNAAKAGRKGRTPGARRKFNT
jgi:hypothetical protein